MKTVGEQSAYHHGEQSLMQTIIGLAQNFVGSNNINLLKPGGQFGTRLQGGKDHASARYINTMLSPLARKIFPKLDDPLLTYLFDDNLRVEPEFYVPIIPMVLVNGAEGIGTGWSTKIPNYNPREIVANIKRLLDYDPVVPMMPWFKGFRGEIHQVETTRFLVNGEVAEIADNQIEITELPVRTWTQNYKEYLETLSNPTDKNAAFISDFKEYHTDTTVRFVIKLPENNLRKADSEGFHKTFKLQTTFSTTSMVLFDSNGCLKRYESPEEILEEFYNVRLNYYDKRKTYMLGMLEAECDRLKNQARFIQEKIEGDIHIENKKRKHFMATLEQRSYKSDPVKKWKIENNITVEKKKRATEGDGDSQHESGSENDEEANDSYAKDYDYLMDMPMKSMLVEKKEELLKKRDAKLEELRQLENTSIQDLWRRDLDSFVEELDKFEAAEREAIESGATQVKLTGKINAGKIGKSKSVKSAVETKPSAFGRRIEPKIDLESYQKKEAKKNIKKEPKSSPKDSNNSSAKKKPLKKKKKTESDESETEMSEDEEERPKLKLTLKKKDIGSDSDSDFVDREAYPKRENAPTKKFVEANDDSEAETPKPAKPKQKFTDSGDSDPHSDFDPNGDSGDDSDYKTKKSKGKKRKDDDSDFEMEKKKSAAAKKKKEAVPKKTKTEAAPPKKKEAAEKPTKEKASKKDVEKPAAKRTELPTKSSKDFGFSDSDDDLPSNRLEKMNQQVFGDKRPASPTEKNGRPTYDMSDDELAKSLVAPPPKPSKPVERKNYSDDSDQDFQDKKKQKRSKASSSEDSDFSPEKKVAKSKKVAPPPKKKAAGEKKPEAKV